MKRQLLVLALGLSFLGLQAQTTEDLYRYLQSYQGGSARITGLGQAGGALKGDLYSISINPAAAALFDYGAFSVSTALNNNSNRSQTGEFTDTASSATLKINQASGLLVFVSDKSVWNKITFGFSYDQTAAYDNRIKAGGFAEEGLDHFFLGFAEQNNYIDLLPFDNEFIEEAYRRIGADYGYAAQQGFLGVYSGLIGYDELGYFSRVNYYGLLQRYNVTEKGAMGKFTLHSSISFKDRVLLGGSVAIQDLKFERFSYLNEEGYDSPFAASKSSFDNYLFTSGLGVSAQLGMLIKLSKAFVLGASYSTPTWYTMNDQTAQRISTDAALEDLSYINFGLLNFYDDYRMKLPSSLTFNVALHPSEGMSLVADYRRENYGDAQYLPNSNASFAAENQAMKSAYSTVETLGVGAEFTKGNRLIRFGYSSQSVPAIGGSIGASTAISTGIGYRYQNAQLDFGLRHETRDDNVYFFDALLPNAALVKRSNLRLIATYTLSL
jgi:hypothetical protein